MLEPFECLRADLPPEVQLLLCCARMQMDTANAERISALLQENIDWSSLLQMAFRHNVMPLVYRNLEAICPTAIPETARTQLKAQIQVGIQGNLFLTKELLQLLALLNQHGVLAVPYKGPVLAVAVYGDLMLRPFSDLDILVHEQDIVRTVDLLTSCGYEIIRPPHVARTVKRLQSRCVHQLVLKSSWAYQVVLRHPNRQVVVEVHWRVMPKYVVPLNPEQLWTKLTPLRLAGVTVLSFAPEHLLWFLCVHGAKHHWERLNWLCDIAELIRVSPNLDWAQIVEQAKKLGIERRLYLGLFLANSLLKTPLPQVIATKLHTSPQVRVLAQQVIEGVFDDTDPTDKYPSIEWLAFHLRAMDRMVDRGRYLLHFVYMIATPAPADRAMVRLPSLLASFYYLLRPIRLATMYGLKPFRRLLKI
jgi:hypothetical protein